MFTSIKVRPPSLTNRSPKKFARADGRGVSFVPTLTFKKFFFIGKEVGFYLRGEMFLLNKTKSE